MSEGRVPARDVDDAIRRMRDAAAGRGHDDGPGAPGTVDPDVLRTVLATLPHDDQRLLWAHHVRGRDLVTIAAEIDTHARALRRRLHHAEQRLATAFADAHARACPPGCVDTRTALREYVGHRLGPRRRTVLEEHLFGCDGCMRAFIDVRQASWALRDAAPLLLGGMSVATAGPVVLGATAAGSAGAGIAGVGSVGAALAAAWEWLRGQVLRLDRLGKAGLAGAGVVAVVAATAVAVPLVGGGPGGSAPAASSSSAPDPGAAPPVEVPTETSTEAPDAPADDPTPEPSVEPSTDPSTTDPSTGEPSDGATTDRPAPAPTSRPESPDAGNPEPSDDPGTSEPAPRPTGSEPEPTPTSSSPPATPTPTPSPTTPTPTPTPTEPVSRTVTVTVPRSVGRLYEVVPQGDDAEVVRVSSPDRGVTPWPGSRKWYVGSVRGDAGTVSVELEGAPGTRPTATLKRLGPWKDD